MRGIHHRPGTTTAVLPIAMLAPAIVARRPGAPVGSGRVRGGTLHVDASRESYGTPGGAPVVLDPETASHALAR